MKAPAVLPGSLQNLGLPADDLDHAEPQEPTRRRRSRCGLTATERMIFHDRGHDRGRDHMFEHAEDGNVQPPPMVTPPEGRDDENETYESGRM